jgi:hypothetical protein
MNNSALPFAQLNDALQSRGMEVIDGMLDTRQEETLRLENLTDPLVSEKQ